MRTRHTLFFICLLFSAASAESAPSKQSAVELAADFSRQLPEQVTLSPSGSKVAYITRDTAQTSIVIEDSGTGAHRVEYPSIDASSLLWLSEDTLFVVIKLDTGGAAFLLKAESQLAKPLLNVPSSIVELVANQPDAQVTGRAYFSLYRSQQNKTELLYIDVHDPQFAVHRMGMIDAMVDEWLIGRSGELRGYTQSDRLDKVLTIFDSAKTPFIAFRSEEKNFPQFSSLGSEGEYLIASAYSKEGTREVFRWNIRNARLEERISGDDPSDVTQVLFSKDGSRLLSVRRSECVDREHVLDPAFGALTSKLKRVARDWSHFQVVTTSLDDKWVVLLARNRRHIPALVIVDVEKGRTRTLKDLSKYIRRYRPKALQKISVPSKDGIQLPGYIANPNGAARGTVVVLHGGPFEGVPCTWLALESYLAAEGFRAIVVNYRGAPFYGQRLYESGFGEADKRMIDDVDAIVKYACQKGDGATTLVGLSYGGYLALRWAQSVGKFTQLNRLVVINPMVRASDLFGNVPTWAQSASLQNLVRWYGKDADFNSHSLLQQELAVCSPVTIIQAKEDSRAPLSSAQMLAERLRQHSVPTDFVEITGDHEQNSEELRRDLFLEISRAIR